MYVEKKRIGKYIPTSPIEKLKEVKILLEYLEVKQCEFASDHFTNNIWIDNKLVYRGIYGLLPKDKKEMLDLLNNTINILTITDGEILDATILYERGLIHSL